MIDRLTAALADRYRIERELGAGGMATVYLAHDVKHDRQVALKVLKPELAAVLGAERFVVEIKTTAALQHPHILPLFDSGTADGFLFYVMPFVDGETLRDQLNRETQLGVDEALRLTSDIADALHYAHSRGVIHRDIKPENILLANGRPIVADFGIALAVSAAAGGRMTETGLSLGTPHYMSPEQATAEKEISARSDVYSLASVLYEMLAGEPPHTGGSAQAIIMKIIAEPAQPVTKYRKSVPPNVAAALAKALEKVPADRFATAKEFSVALFATTFSYGTIGATGTVGPGAAGTDWRSKLAVPAMVVAVGSLGLLAWTTSRPSAPAPVSRFEVAWDGAAAGEFGNLALSRDGSLFVTVARVGTKGGLFIRRRDELAATLVEGTTDAFNPTVSPDGRRLAFMTGPAIKIVDVAGGLPRELTDSLVGVPGLAWGVDNYIYFDRRGNGPLMRIRETGGAAEVVSTLNDSTGELQHVWPDPLPNGRGVLMVINRGGPGAGASDADGIAVLDLRTGKHRELFRGVFVRYSLSGHLLYVTHEGELLAVPFDQDALATTGAPVSIERGLAVRTGGTGSVDLAISDNGTLAYAIGSQRGSRREVAWATREGTVTPLEPALTGDVREVALSADATQVAFIMRSDVGTHAYITRIGSGAPKRLTFEGVFRTVLWHPNGRELLLSTLAGNQFRVPSDGRSVPTPILGTQPLSSELRWAPKGDSLLLSVRAREGTDVFLVAPADSRGGTPVFSSPGFVESASLSPDGKWILFSAGRVGLAGVFVRPFPNTGASMHEVGALSRQPRWSADGREIYYRTFSDSLMVVSVLPGPVFALGEPRALFSLGRAFSWMPTADGRRFLILREWESTQTKRFVVVENFFTELNARVK